MKKIKILFLFLILFSITLVFSGGLDNIKTFDSSLNKISISDKNNISMSEIVLKNPEQNYVIRGKNKKVFCVEVNNSKDLSNLFTAVDFINLKTKNSIIKSYVIKEEYVKSTEKRIIYISECNQLIDKNLSKYDECILKENGEFNNSIIDYKDFDNTKNFNGIKKLCIFTDVSPNENIDLIPSLFGLQVTEWASWNESFKVGLQFYHKFDDASGTSVLDSANGTNSSWNPAIASWGTDGIIGGDAIFNGLNSIGTQFYTNNTPLSVSFWINMTGDSNHVNTYSYLLSSICGGGCSQNGFALCYEDSSGRLSLYVTNGGSQTLGNDNTFIGTDTINNSQWHHVVIRFFGNAGGGGWELWYDGVNRTLTNTNNRGLMGDSTVKLNISAPSSNGDYAKMKVDEFSYYTRVLSADEISSLYNSGHGMSYGTYSFINVTLNSPSNNSWQKNPVVFNITANSSDINLKLFNASLWGNWTGVWHLNKTNLISGNLNYTNFTLNLSDGTYIWNVLVTDQGLGTNYSIYNFTVKVDNTPPWVNSTNFSFPTNLGNYSGLNKLINISVYDNGSGISTVIFNITNISGKQNASFTANKEGTSNSYSFLFNTTWFPDGMYNITAFVNDTVNNVNNSAYIRITIDNTIPNLTILSPSNNSYFNRSWFQVNITTTDSIFKNVTYFLSGAGSQIQSYTTSTNYTFTALADGVYFFYVETYDNAGNKNTSQLRTETIDTTIPQINLTTPFNTSYNILQTALNYTVSDTNLASCWYSTNGGATNTSVTCGTNLTGLTSNQGSNTWLVGVNDSAGNKNYSKVTFSVDTSSPIVSIIYPLNLGNYSINVSNLNYSVTDTNPSRCWYSNDSGLTNSTSISFGTNFTLVTSNEGLNNWTVYCNDTFGNQGSHSHIFTKDTILPSINIIFPINNSNFSYSNVNINYSRSDTNLQSCWYSNDSMTINTTLTNCINLTTLNWVDGFHNVTIWANDSVGNINSSRVTFRVDTTSPTINMFYPTNYLIIRDLYSYNLSLNISATETGIGVSTYWYSLNGGANVTFTPNTTILGIAGNNTLKVWINDTLNNVATSTILFNLTFTPRINDINISNASTSYDLNSFNTGLVAYYKLDQNNTNQVDSVQGINNGTVYGSAFINLGKVGGAYNFNGVNDYIQTTTSPTLNITKNFTIMLWFYGNMSNQAYTNDTSTLIWRIDDAPKLIIQSNKKLSGTFVYNASPQQGTSIAGNTIITDNVWHMALLEYNSSTLSLYLDNNLENSKVVNYSVIGSDNYFRFGRDDVGRYFNGTIDEVRIYNRSLSATEISNLYQVTNPTFQELANVTINTTITDEDTSQANLYYSWFVDGVSKLAGFGESVFNYIFNRVSQIVQLNINDSNGYFVNQTWNVSENLILPSVIILSPVNNTNTSNILLHINYSISDTNLASCWWTQNKGASNNSIICGQNITGQTWIEGLKNITICGNDSLNNINCFTISFTIDTTNPLIYFNASTETSGTYTSRTNVEINVTASDSNLANITIYLFNPDKTINQTNTSTLSSFFINYTSLSDGIYFFNATARDSANNKNSTETRNVTIDTAFPIVVFNTDTLDDGTNVSQSNIFMHIILVESNFRNISFYLFNDSKILKSSSNYTDSTRSKNFTSLADGFYYYNVSVCDLVNKCGSSSTRIIGLDTTPPNISITLPVNLYIYNYNETINLSTSIMDAISGVSACWVKVINSSNDVIINNQTFNCNETLFNVSVSDNYQLTVYSNDSLNHLNSSTISFGVDMNSPAVSLNYPSNNFYSNHRLNNYFNFTAVDSNGLGNCSLYTNITGVWTINYTWISPNNNTMNFTILNISSDGTFIWNVKCNDSLSNSAFGFNRTFSIDTVYPNALINSSSIITTFGSQTFYFNTSASDLNLLSCKYSVFNSSGGIDGISNNITTDCNINPHVITVSDFGTYNLTFYSIDKAGNENSSTQTITISTLPITPPEGGGTGRSTIVIGNASWAIYTDTGGKKYELNMIQGTSREKYIILKNNISMAVNVSFYCFKISNYPDVCNYTSFGNDSIELPVGKAIDTVNTFKIDLPNNLAKNNYAINVLAIDKDNNVDAITVYVSVGTFGWIAKIGTTFTSSANIAKVPIPYSIIAILGLIIVFSMLYLIGLKKLAGGAAISFVIAIGMIGLFLYLI